MLTLIFGLVHDDEGAQFISVLSEDELSWLHCLRLFLLVKEL